MIPTTRAGSWSFTVASASGVAVSPFFEVSAVSMSPTGRDEAWASWVGWGAVGVGGDARDAGPVTASAQAPTSARSAVGFFVVMCVTPMCRQAAALGREEDRAVLAATPNIPYKRLVTNFVSHWETIEEYFTNKPDPGLGTLTKQRSEARADSSSDADA